MKTMRGADVFRQEVEGVLRLLFPCFTSPSSVRPFSRSPRTGNRTLRRMVKTTFSAPATCSRFVRCFQGQTFFLNKACVPTVVIHVWEGGLFLD